jgi:4-hydroxyacetophenone monooxygenase
MADGATPADKGYLRKALQHAHHPTLSLVYLHLTGDDRFLKAPYQPAYEPLGGDPDGGLSEAAKEELREAVIKAAEAYSISGTLAEAPDKTTLQAMMNYTATDTIPEEYFSFLSQELPVKGEDRRMPGYGIDLSRDWSAEHKMIIVGAGMSGLLAGIVFKSRGIPFEIIEKNPDLGGTWFENTYPGCRVDSPNHIYSYSFEADHDWPHHFSTQQHIYDYFNKMADKYGLRSFIRFNTEVKGMVYDESSQTWSVTIQSESGAEEVLISRGVVSAVGQLNQPSYPDIKGIDRFKGPAFHSARWDHSVDLTKKRVGVIGTGASAFQFVPEIAGKVGEMTVFQRTAGWFAPTPEYHEALTPEKLYLLQKLPFYQIWYRFFLFIAMGDAPLAFLQKDPDWKDYDYAPNEAGAGLRKQIEDYIREQAGEDTALANALTPDFQISGKRSLRDNGIWINALKQDNVTLDTKGIREITETGVISEDGVHHEFDVLIYGTGFKAQDFLYPMSVKGMGGKDLHEMWDGDGRAYKGVTVPDFPNLYLMYGPNTNIVVNASIIFFSESEAHYMVELMKFMEKSGTHALNVRKDAYDAYNQMIDAANAEMPWGYAKANSWYRNAKGRVAQNWPLRLIDFWNQSREVRPNAYDILK